MELRTTTSYHARGGNLLLILLGQAYAACQIDTASQIGALATEVEAAFDRVDDDAFEAAYQALGLAVGCIRSPVSLEDLALWHRARALGESWEREMVASSKSWSAVKVLQPTFRPPDAWMPEGSALRTAWDTASMDASRVQLERTPAGGWFVDGQRTNGVPTERGFVLQGFDRSGSVVHTNYHYSIAEVPIVDFVALDPTVRQLRRRRIHAAGTSLAATTTIAAGVTAFIARTDKVAALSRDTPVADVAGHAARANRLSDSAAGLGLLSAALLTTTWTVPW